MSTITNDEVPYSESEKDEEIKTKWGDGEPKKGNTRGLLGLPEAILNMTLPKQFLILSMIIYGVIAYSKGEKGVNIEDLSSFTFFILFIIIVFVALIISKYIWNNERLIWKSFKNYLELLFVFSVAVSLFIIFKLQIINFIKNLIESFVNFKS